MSDYLALAAGIVFVFTFASWHELTPNAKVAYTTLAAAMLIVAWGFAL
jgi:hypothetical protein